MPPTKYFNHIKAITFMKISLHLRLQHTTTPPAPPACRWRKVIAKTRLPYSKERTDEEPKGGGGQAGKKSTQKNYKEKGNRRTRGRR